MRIVRNNEEKGSAFDKHFRELRNTEETPSADLWDRVDSRLDEDRRRAKHEHWYYALLFLLIPLTAINIYVTYDFKALYASLFDESATEQPAIEPVYLGSNLPSQLFSTEGASVPVSAESLLAQANSVNKDAAANFTGARNPDGIITGQEGANGITGSSASSHSANNKKSSASSSTTAAATSAENVSSIDLSEIALIDLIPADRLMLETDATPQDVKFSHARNVHERKQSAVKGFHMGLEAGVNNSMILMNQNNLEPLVSENIHRKLDLGGYYAVSVGYDFSRKFGIESELIFCSSQGQKYSELRHGKIHIDGEIDLKYLSVPVLFKYKMTRMGGKNLNPRVLNFVAGLQYSRLKDAHVRVNNLDLQNATTPFNRDELGVVLGLEYDLFVNPNYFFTFGTRASISSDMGTFPFFIPQASQTYNVLVGANVSFHYLMKR